jgi:hypothetical protein
MTGAEMFLGAAILISLCVVAGWAAGARRDRPPEAPPATWWACPTCHSVNEGVAGPEDTCYRCGRVADPTAIQQLETAAEFEVVQQFGSTRKGGWERTIGWAADQTEPPDETTSDETPTTG